MRFNEAAGIRIKVRHLLVRQVPGHAGARSTGNQFPNEADIQDVRGDVGEVERPRPIRIAPTCYLFGQHGVLDDPRGSRHVDEHSNLLCVSGFAYDLAADL